MNKIDIEEIKKELDEVRIALYAERAYYYAYPHLINKAHKERAMKKMINYIKSDIKFPKFFELVGYAKCIK
jgi:hypothetical protein